LAQHRRVEAGEYLGGSEAVADFRAHVCRINAVSAAGSGAFWPFQDRRDERFHVCDAVCLVVQPRGVLDHRSRIPRGRPGGLRGEARGVV